MTPHYSDALVKAPVAVVLLALEGKLELQRQRPYVIDFLTGDEDTIWIEDSGNPVGVLCARRQKGGRVWWVDMSYVHPEARLRGVHMALREELRKRAKAAGAQAIEYLVRIDNEGQLASMRKAGIEPTSYHVRYEP
jgi:GNAT superfamily N-acetyltransferase